MVKLSFVNFIIALVALYVVYMITLSMSSRKTDKSGAEKFSENKKLVFVYADWCGHCTRFKPTWSKIETFSKTNNAFQVEALNVDDEQNKIFIDRYEVNSFPTLMIFAEGRFKKYEGDREFSDILSAVENY